MILHDEFAKIYMAINNIEDGLKLADNDKRFVAELIATLRREVSIVLHALATKDQDDPAALKS